MASLARRQFEGMISIFLFFFFRYICFHFSDEKSELLCYFLINCFYCQILGDSDGFVHSPVEVLINSYFFLF